MKKFKTREEFEAYVQPEDENPELMRNPEELIERLEADGYDVNDLEEDRHYTIHDYIIMYYGFNAFVYGDDTGDLIDKENARAAREDKSEKSLRLFQVITKSNQVITKYQSSII